MLSAWAHGKTALAASVPTSRRLSAPQVREQPRRRQHEHHVSTATVRQAVSSCAHGGHSSTSPARPPSPAARLRRRQPHTHGEIMVSHGHAAAAKSDPVHRLATAAAPPVQVSFVKVWHTQRTRSHIKLALIERETVAAILGESGHDRKAEPGPCASHDASRLATFGVRMHRTSLHLRLTPVDLSTGKFARAP